MKKLQTRYVPLVPDLDPFIDRVIDMEPERGLIYYHWEVTEEIQDALPYNEWGWDGFIPMLLFRS
jgi:hypothetical protein